MVLRDITYRHAIHVVKEDKERFTKLTSICMGKLLIKRYENGLLGVIRVVIQDEITYGLVLSVMSVSTR
jgi:hypothetical protein